MANLENSVKKIKDRRRSNNSKGIDNELNALEAHNNKL